MVRTDRNTGPEIHVELDSGELALELSGWYGRKPLELRQRAVDRPSRVPVRDGVSHPQQLPRPGLFEVNEEPDEPVPCAEIARPSAAGTRAQEADAT